ncbi:MAG: hypothetical protein ACK5MV_13595 [Aminipila sp.]
MKYKVTFAKFIDVEIEADNKEQAEEKANYIDESVIEANDDSCGHEVWAVQLS